MTDKIYEKKKPIPIKLKQNNIKIYSWGFSKNGQTGIENCQYTPEPHNIKFQSPNNERKWSYFIQKIDENKKYKQSESFNKLFG